jgi:hypothetical protein
MLLNHHGYMSSLAVVAGSGGLSLVYTSSDIVVSFEAIGPQHKIRVLSSYLGNVSGSVALVIESGRLMSKISNAASEAPHFTAFVSPTHHQRTDRSQA